MSMKRQSYAKHLTCDRHGNTQAEKVCGSCGTPLCDECAETIYDPTFSSFTTSGATRRLVLGITLIVGMPILHALVLGDLITQIRLMLFPTRGLFPRVGLVHSSVILGMALLLTVWFRKGDIVEEPLMLRQGSERTLCEDCTGGERLRRYLQLAVAGVALIIVLYGAYRLVTALNLAPLRVIAIGGAVYILRDTLVALVIGLAS